MHPTRPLAIRAIQKVITMTHSPEEKKAAHKALQELLGGTDREEMEAEGFEYCEDCGELITEYPDAEIPDVVCLSCWEEAKADRETQEDLEHYLDYRR